MKKSHVGWINQNGTVLLHPCKVEFSHKANHIRCFPYVINVCSNHIIEAFTSISLTHDTGEFITSTLGPPSDPDNHSYKQAVACDPIALCWSTIWAIYASGQQNNHLAEVIVDEKKNGLFKSTKDLIMTIQVKQAQFVDDIKVWWDSLYFMINWIQKLCLVCLNPIIL